MKYIILILIIVATACKPESQETTNIQSEKPNAYALDGTPLFLPAPSLDLVAKYNDRRITHINDPDNPDALIWHGRYAAYTGDYVEAISLFTQGINKFPRDARMYRHRGHRYITTRQFDKAIIDLSFAGQLIQGTENQVEPDGIPNARGIPVSTLHGNIYYHLGLAYYLEGNLEQALEAYLECLRASEMADNLVSSTHWLYTILRKLGRDREAQELLKPIEKGIDIIENTSYYKLCLFYKGLISEEELLRSDVDGSANDAILYGLAAWYGYNNKKGVEKARLASIIESSGWNSFGYIAAEADLLRMKIK